MLDEEEPEEGLKKNADGEVEEDEETVDEDEYDEMELEEVCLPFTSLSLHKMWTYALLCLQFACDLQHYIDPL